MLPSDVLSLIESLRQKASVRLLARYSDFQHAVEMISQIFSENEIARAQCYLAPGSESSIVLSPSHGRWTIDTDASEAIEFNGCYFTRSTLKRGRLYYTKGYYRDGKWNYKSDAFLDCANIVFRETKKILKRFPALDAYVGPDAAKWKNKGGSFISIAIKGGASIVAGS
jgi:hypothetical protein